MTPAWNHGFQYHAWKGQALLLLALGRPNGALRRFEQMLQRWPADRYALASQAHLQVQFHRLDAAVSSLQQLTGIKGSVPQQAAALFNLGYVLQQAARHDEAGLAFRSALALDSALDRAWYGLALVLIHQRKFLDAVDALKKNTALQPLSPYGWYRLVQVWLALGQPKKARQIIAHLRQFEPRVAAQLEREHALTCVEHHAAH
jgi:tetratricopeptide (TPR) repeat protein